MGNVEQGQERISIMGNVEQGQERISIMGNVEQGQGRIERISKMGKVAQGPKRGIQEERKRFRRLVYYVLYFRVCEVRQVEY